MSSSEEIKSSYSLAADNVLSLKNVPKEKLEQILSDFSFLKNDDLSHVSAEKDTMFISCFDPRLTDLFHGLRKSGGYGFGNPAGEVFPVSDEVNSNNLKNNIVTEFRLILASDNELNKFFVIGHSDCGAIKLLDKTLIQIFKEGKSECQIDGDKVRLTKVFGEEQMEMLRPHYESLNSPENGRAERLKNLEKMVALVSAANIKEYISDTEIGSPSLIRENTEFRDKLASQSPQIYACYADVSGPNSLASKDLSVFIPELKDFIYLSTITKFLTGKEPEKGPEYHIAQLRKFKSGAKSETVGNPVNLYPVLKELSGAKAKDMVMAQ